jgi:hypothetical protein
VAAAWLDEQTSQYERLLLSVFCQVAAVAVMTPLL